MSKPAKSVSQRRLISAMDRALDREYERQTDAGFFAVLNAVAEIKRSLGIKEERKP